MYELVASIIFNTTPKILESVIVSFSFLVYLNTPSFSDFWLGVFCI